MYAREDTVNWLLAKRSNTNILGGPLKQSCVHLASARRSGQAAQVKGRYNRNPGILTRSRLSIISYLDRENPAEPQLTRDEVQGGHHGHHPLVLRHRGHK